MVEPYSFVTDDTGGVTVMRDGHPQSYVNLSDPGLLVFEYMQHLATGLQLLPDGPIAITHAGGAGLSLPRYVQATRPGSTQIVLEPDAALTQAVRRELPLPRGHRIRVRATDAATGLRALRPESADAFVLDAFAGGRVPAELTTVETLTLVRSVLRPGGLALLNVTDEPDQRYLARVIAGAQTVFEDVAVLSLHDVLKRKRFGNYTVLAGRAALDVGHLRRCAARSAVPTGVRAGEQVPRMRMHARPLTATDPMASPPPPESGGWRVR